MFKTYGIDLDGVTFDFKTPLGLYIQEKTGIEYDPESILCYHWYECIDELTKEMFWKCFHEFGNNGGYARLEPEPGAIEGIHRILADGHSVRFITHRPGYAFNDTVKSLNKHNLLGGEYKKTALHFANGGKATLVNQYNVDVFIDDSPDTVSELVAHTRAHIYCMDHLFNRNLDDNNGKWFTRVYNFDEFLEHEGIGVGNA